MYPCSTVHTRESTWLLTVAQISGRRDAGMTIQAPTCSATDRMVDSGIHRRAAGRGRRIDSPRRPREQHRGIPIIEVNNLHKRYRNTTAVEEVPLSVDRGEIFGILGRNGAGKTATGEHRGVALPR